MINKEQMKEIIELRTKLRNQASKGQEIDAKMRDRLQDLLEETNAVEELGEDID